MKDLEKMKKSELQAFAKEQGVTYARNATVEQIIDAIEKQRTNGKPIVDKGSFALMKTHYKAVPQAKILSEFPHATGELKILAETHWNDERNVDNQSFIRFQVGSAAVCTIFSGQLLAAAERDGVDILHKDENGKLYFRQGFLVSIAPKKFQFDKR